MARAKKKRAAKKKKPSTKKAAKKPSVVEEKPAEKPAEEAKEEKVKPKAAPKEEKPVEEAKEEKVKPKAAPKEEKPVEEKKEEKPKPKAAPKKEKPVEGEEFKRIVFEDKFDKNRAFKHVESIAIPRMIGSEGEEKAQKYITDHFKKIGLKPVEEEFEYTDYAWTILIRLFQGLKALLIVVALLMFLFQRTGLIIGSIISVAILIMVMYSSIWARFFWKYQDAEGKLFPVNKYKSKNIMAKIACAEGTDKASGDIIVLADYDSKSQTLPALIRVIAFYLSLIVSMAFPIGYISYFILYLTDPNLVASNFLLLLLLILACISVISNAALELNRTGNDSPGAINNATGVGTLLELAEIHTKEPLEKMNLTFLTTGAGEQGLFGAVSFFKAHESEYNKEDTFVINLKDIAGRGHFYIPGPIGFPPQLPCLEVENLYKKTLKRRKIPIKEGSNTKIRVLSPWVFTGAWNDDMIAVLRGFYANRIGIGGNLRKLHIIHTKKDNIDQVEIDAIDIVGKVTAEVLKRLDIRARP